MPQGDQLDDYTVFFYIVTLLFCFVPQALAEQLYSMIKATFNFLNIFLCNALPENCLILRSLVFLNQAVTIHVIHVLLF